MKRIQEERINRDDKKCSNNILSDTNNSTDLAPKRWCIAKIGEIVECLDKRRIPVNKAKRQECKGNIPYYGANGQVGWINDFIFNEDLLLVVEDETFLGRQIPFSYIVRGKSWVNNHAHVLKPLGGMSVEYLNICFSYYNFTPLTTGTTGRRKLTQKALLNASFCLAPLAEQEEIVRRVEALFQKCDQIEARYQKAKAYTDKLTQAILAKAFRGELVPQDPNDEPAEVLLERIRQEKDAKATTKPKKTTKKRGKKASSPQQTIPGME